VTPRTPVRVRQGQVEVLGYVGRRPQDQVQEYSWMPPAQARYGILSLPREADYVATEFIRPWDDRRPA
jgi:hypothetical protein